MLALTLGRWAVALDVPVLGGVTTAGRLLAASVAVAALLLADAWGHRARRRRGGRARSWALAGAALGLWGLIAAPALRLPGMGPSSGELAAGAARPRLELRTAPRVSGDELRVGRVAPVPAATAVPEAPTAANRGPQGEVHAADASGLARRLPTGESLSVVGWGLRRAEWQALSAFPVVRFDPAALPTGFSSVLWPRAAVLGAPITVEGRFHLAAAEDPAPAAEPWRIVLVDPSGRDAASLDALEASRGGAIPFRLTATPRATGPNLYRLEARRGAETRAGEPIDVDVDAARALRVLWLEAAPSAESLAVRRWLLGMAVDAEDGGGPAFALRSLLSRDRARTLWWGPVAASDPSLPAIERLDEAALALFDLVVAEPGAVTAAERLRLGATAREAGIGLLWRWRAAGRPGPGSSPSDERLPAGLRWDVADPEGEVGELRVRPRLGAERLAEPLEIGARTLELGATPTPGARPGSGPSPATGSPWGWSPLATDAADRLLAVRRPLGAGFEAVTAVEATFRWPLRGAGADFAAWWTRLFEAIARPPDGPRLGIEDGPLRVDRPLRILLEGEWARAAAVRDGSSPGCALRVVEPDGASTFVAPRQDDLESTRFAAAFWPRLYGWHRAECRVDPGLDAERASAGEAESAAATTTLVARFWAAPRDAWTTEEAARRVEETWAHVGVSAERAQARPAAKRALTPIPPLVFFSLLLGGIVAVWAIERWG